MTTTVTRPAGIKPHGPVADLRPGDCRDVLPTLEAGSVAAIVTDPPYGQTNEAYDGPVAFDPALWRECHRIAGPDAALISFAGSPTYHRIASAVEAAGWKVRQMWGWVYRDGLITSAWPGEGFDRLAPAFDPILYATKGKILLNLRREGGQWDKGRRLARPTYSARASSQGKTGAGGHWPRALVAEDVPGFEYFALARTNGGSTERDGHPNQKPLALLRWLVSKLPPGGTILDPFMGSGTTAVAALREGFEFIGVEQNPAYLDIARRRVDAALKVTA